MKYANCLARRIHSSKLLLNAVRATLALTAFCATAMPTQAATVIGDSGKWSPITLDFIGVTAKETDTSPNPFLDYRLTVNLTAPSGRTVAIPGFFAGDGNGFGEGNHWQARFAADEIGTWRYQGVFHSGSNIAINLDLSKGTSIPLEASSGTFNVVAQSEDAPGFLKHGRLQYIGEHYMKFQDGPYWIKGGTDSPENILGFAGIDGTEDQLGNFLHRFENHVKDAESSDPIFSNNSTGVDGRGLTGALNYLSEQGINSIYFLPMNLGGDGWDTYPFVGGEKTNFNKTHYDLSKLHQWNAVLNHAQRRGIALNIVLSETERDNERWLDDGKLGTERKLFFRELIARFGYLLAAKWNLGEENDFPVSELRLHADYIRALDWTEKPIAVHTQINDFRDYEKIVGEERFSATSIQYDHEFAGEFVEQWRKRSADAGHPWILDMDENTNGVSDTDYKRRRKQILYDVLFSGGQIEWYFGYYPMPLGGDITAGDFRLRENMWTSTTIARKFMEKELPFWRMEPNDSLLSGENGAYGGAEVFAAANEVYAIYLPNANGNQTLDLSGTTGNFVQQWFNPSSGEFEGSSRTLASNQKHALGAAPSRINDDWVVLVRSTTATKPNANDFSNNQEVNTPAPPPPESEKEIFDTTAPSNNGNESIKTDDEQKASNTLPELRFDAITTAVAGKNYKLTFAASDADGVAPVVTVDTLPAGISIKQVYDGVFELSGYISENIGDSMSIELIAIDSRFRDLRVTKSINIPIRVAAKEDQPAPEDVSNLVKDEPNDVQIIDNPPIILGVRNVRVEPGANVSIIIVPVDIEGIVPSLRMMELPEGATFNDNGNGTRTFNWTPTTENIGTTELKFIATDAGKTPHVVQSVGSIEVIEKGSKADVENVTTEKQVTNYPPMFRAIASQTVALGSRVSFRVTAIDPEGKAPIKHLLNPPEGSSFIDNGDGTRTFQWVAQGVSGQVINLHFTAIDGADYSLTSSIAVPITLQ